MVHAAGAAQGHFPVGVHVVVAQPVVGRGPALGWHGLGRRAVGLRRGGVVVAAVGPLLVVVVAEFVELALQLAGGAGCGLFVQPAFEGLVEAFDLALGLRVSRGAVFLAYAEDGQEVFEGVAPASEAGGVDAAVVCEGRGRGAVDAGGGQERGDHVVPGDGLVGGAGQQVAGVVVEPVEDLDVGAVRQAPVGEVGLPGLVGLGGFEADVGGSGAFSRFGRDEPGAGQRAVDGGG